MNVSLRWLCELAPTLELDVDAVVERLALRGAPVDACVYLAQDLGEVLVARVEATERHPNADKLTLCTVNVGGEFLRVVCGATNVHAGGIYPFAPVGSSLPGGVAIGKRKIRGEVSMGMLCSARELRLGTDHSGILELPGGLEPGSGLVEALALDDWRLEVEVTANRPDLLSHLGIARELAPGGIGDLTLPLVPGGSSLAVGFAAHPVTATVPGATVCIEEPELCSRYLGAVVRGVRVEPSPEWLQARLRAAGARPINNVVDATNYVLLELGQPLHAFDLAKLAESTIVVRRARDGESTFRTLDGEDRRITDEMLMICDAERPVAVAGVMGGLDSEVTAATTDLLLECALFEPSSIRSTRKALGLSTDASYRFERGVDPEGMEKAIRRTLEIIVATAGGIVEPLAADCLPRPWKSRAVPLRPARIERVLGVPFTSSALPGLLEPLGFGVTVQAPDEERAKESLDVTVPGYRSYDVRREIDLIEEVARAHGFDAFPDVLGPYRPGTVPDHPLFRLEDELRRMLAERGLYETQSPAFVPASEGDVRIENPVSLEEPCLRRYLLPALLRRVEHNLARGLGDVRLFELATSFQKGAEGAPPEEEPHLAAVLTGSRSPGHWSDGSEPFDLWDLKGLLRDVAGWAGLDARLEGEAPPARFIVPDEGFRVLGRGSITVGWGGRVAPDVVDAPPWASPIWAFELALPQEPGPPPVLGFQPLPAYPAVERDLALLVREGVPAQRVEDVIREAASYHLRQVVLFDLYTGSGIPAGTHSLAYRLRFQSTEKTLVDEDVDQAVQAVTRALERELGVHVRG